MIISKTQLDLIRRSSDEILLNKYDYYNSMPVRTLTALLNLKDAEAKQKVIDEAKEKAKTDATRVANSAATIIGLCRNARS